MERNMPEILITKASSYKCDVHGCHTVRSDCYWCLEAWAARYDALIKFAKRVMAESCEMHEDCKSCEAKYVLELIGYEFDEEVKGAKNQ